MDMNKPLFRFEPDPDTPCTSDYPWVAHRPADMPDDMSNVICPGCDVVIATRLPNRVAMGIADAHNGTFTPHETDGTTLIP